MSGGEAAVKMGVIGAPEVVKIEDTNGSYASVARFFPCLFL